jgi:Ras-related protein Rab-1A
MKTLQLDDKVCKLQIWDTTGQEKFRTITRSYYRGAGVILIIYDITDTESFKEATTKSFAEVKEFAPNAVLVLVGTKKDLESKREVGTAQGEQFSLENGMHFLETSAAEEINVDSVFKLAASKCIELAEAKEEEDRAKAEEEDRAKAEEEDRAKAEEEDRAKAKKEDRAKAKKEDVWAMAEKEDVWAMAEKEDVWAMAEKEDVWAMAEKEDRDKAD